MIGIYKITSPSGKIYIGQSVNIEQRWKDHKGCSDKVPLYSSFKKYGYNNHILEILEECLVELLNERERYWQDFYDVLGPNGLNCKLTKTTDLSGSHSEETKRKIGRANKDRVLSKEVKEKKLEKLRSTLASKTEEEKLITRNKRSKAKKLVWTDELKEKRKRTIEAKGEQAEIDRRNRISKTQQERTEEEKSILSKKNSDGLKKAHSNKTEEEKLELAKKISSALKEKFRLKREQNES